MSTVCLPFSPRRAPQGARRRLTQRLLWLGLIAASANVGFASPASPLDRDGNGLDDVWEAAYGKGLSPATDLDGDGFDAHAESLAGTDPRDAASAPRLLTPERLPGEVARLRWPTVPGKRYTLWISGDLTTWHEISVPSIGDGAEHSVDVALATSFTGGGAALARWDGVDWFTTLKNYAAAGAPEPTLADRLDTLDAPRAAVNGDRPGYGQWVHGWIVPPASGDTTFWVSSDDYTELWLSTDADPAHRSRILYFQGYTDPDVWTDSADQHSTPITLQANHAYYFEAWHIDWGWGNHLQIGWTGAAAGGATTPVIIAAPYLSNDGQSLASLTAGGRRFFRLQVDDVDQDGDGVTDYAEHLAGLDPLDASTTPRRADMDALLSTLDSASSLTIGTEISRAYESAIAGDSSEPGSSARFVIYRSGGLSPLGIHYTVSGTATSGEDFTPLSGTVSMPAGVNQATIDLTPLFDTLTEPPETVTLTLSSDSNYIVGVPASATATIDDAPDVLYVATLRGVDDSGSGGYGTAAVRITGNDLSARAALSFGNLRSPEVSANLYVSSTGASGATALSLPAGQVSSLDWSVPATESLSRDDILTALREGRLWARVSSSLFPDGEIRGLLVPTPGWDTMPTPPTPPAAPTSPADDAAAARFLIQATFGPTADSIARVRELGYAGWIDEQLTLPATLHVPYYIARRDEFLAESGGDSDGWQTPRQEAWWQDAITAPDQLRQRVAWALSQILVISQAGSLAGEHEGTTTYYDLLVSHAFGNYRTLLEDVTLSPMMGQYLSMIRNRKPDPETGQQPDENYAREVMQLFSIGLSELHPDGTLRLDADGMPVPTYTQADIVGLAHIFTGWGPHYDDADPPYWEWSTDPVDRDTWFQWGWDPLRPMTFYANYSDTESRTIVGGVTLSGSLSGPERLEHALDTLFNHPNVGPFVSKQLIQRLVTSNPSPGYVYRVASVFADDGHGVRGNLGAVVRAILLDPEALRPESAGDYAFGKPVEPLLRLTRLFRAYPLGAPLAAQGDTRLFLNYQYDIPEQAPLFSPTVFNFYQPGYTPPGRLAAAGLVGPEFQIINDTTVATEANLLFGLIYWGHWTGLDDPSTVYLDLTTPVSILQAAGRTPAQAQGDLLDHLDVRLLGGQMSSSLRAQILAAYAALPSWYGYSDDSQLQRVHMALYLITTSPDYCVQR